MYLDEYLIIVPCYFFFILEHNPAAKFNMASANNVFRVQYSGSGSQWFSLAGFRNLSPLPLLQQKRTDSTSGYTA